MALRIRLGHSLAILGFASSITAMAADNTHEPEIRLERPDTGCVNVNCVLYALKVYSDGTVKFKGVRGVKRIGTATGTIEMQKLEVIRGKLDHLSSKALLRRYAIPNLADAGLIRIEYRTRNELKMSVEYQPVLSGEITSALSEVVSMLENVIQPYGWIR